MDANVRPIFLLIAALGALPIVGTCEPIFSGVLVDKSKTYVAISLNGESPSWVVVGDSIGPYSVKAFNAITEVVSLESKGKVFELKLPDSRVKPRVDIQVIESLAKRGNVRLAAMLKSYRRGQEGRHSVQASVDSFKNSAASSKTTQKMDAVREKLREIDVALSVLFERMSAEAAADMHRK